MDSLLFTRYVEQIFFEIVFVRYDELNCVMKNVCQYFTKVKESTLISQQLGKEWNYNHGVI